MSRSPQHCVRCKTGRRKAHHLHCAGCIAHLEGRRRMLCMECGVRPATVGKRCNTCAAKGLPHDA